MSSMGRPLHMIRSDGIVKHAFQIDTETARKIADQFHLKILADSDQDFAIFGTITENGCLQFWELTRFCRPFLSVQAGFEKCSWAAVAVIDEQVRLLVYSREAGLCMSSTSKDSIGDSDFSIMEIPNGPHVGFCQPVFQAHSNEVTLINSADSLTHIHIASLTCQVYKPEGITHLTFLKGFQSRANLLLIGSESGKISLVDISKSNPQILDQVDFFENEMIQSGKKKCRVSPEDNVAIPLCCDGDDSNGIGTFVIGTKANVVVAVSIQFHSKEENNDNHQRLSVSNVKVIPNPGASSVVLHPNKEKVLVTTWDSKVRIFTFPHLEFLQTIEWSLYPQIGVVSFIEKTIKSSSSVSYFLILVSNSPAFSIWNFDLSNAVSLKLNT